MSRFHTTATPFVVVMVAVIGAMMASFAGYNLGSNGSGSFEPGNTVFENAHLYKVGITPPHPGGDGPPNTHGPGSARDLPPIPGQ